MHSSHGTKYMITISDLTKFTTFGAKFFTAGKIDKVKTDKEDLNYFISGVNTGTDLANNEKGMLHYLESNDSGLNVLKWDETAATWSQIKRSSTDTVETIPCT